jgi:hypothetical protein
MRNMNQAGYLSVTFFAAIFAVEAHAAPVSDFQLIINDSNPNAVTVTATGTDPFEPDSAHNFNEGIDLLNFFSTPSTSVGLPSFTSSGDLTTGANGSPTYVDAGVDNFTGRYVDLNLFNDGSADPETFQSGTAAFTGTEVYDLIDLASVLPTGIERGPILAGFSGDTNGLEGDSMTDLAGFLTYIGDYEVIPEPSQWSLLLLGAASLVAVRRLRASRAN